MHDLSIQQLLASGALGITILLLLWAKGFFSIAKKPPQIHVDFVMIATLLAIFWGGRFIVQKVLFYFLDFFKIEFNTSPNVFYIVFGFFVPVLILLLLYAVAQRFTKDDFCRLIFGSHPQTKAPSTNENHLNSAKEEENTSKMQSILLDAIWAFVLLVISIPMILFISELCEYINYLIFNEAGAEQIVVTNFRNSATEPLKKAVMLFSILIYAPMTEELLFRGFVLNYLKPYIGSVGAIIGSAAVFSVFHFSLAQGIGNLPILVSLFVFALYLGFLYEKRGSLIATILMHFGFNAINVLRIQYM